MDTRQQFGNLVLTRRAGESILVGDDIRISVVRINVHGVQLKISAPRDVRIMREEIADRE